MWVSQIKINNKKCFEDVDIRPSKGINVIVGKNNSGKSTLLSIFAHMQQNLGKSPPELRIGKSSSTFGIFFSGDMNHHLLNNNITSVRQHDNSLLNYSGNRAISSFSAFPGIEPDNYIYPFFTTRKVATYAENVGITFSNAVSGNFGHLYSKVDRIANPSFMPAHAVYKEACESILGIMISGVPSTSGKTAAYTVRNLEQIPISSMGEGTVNIIGLLVDLCVAEKKLFLIEELENDVHPSALKKLLDVIIEKSQNNQFFITTHSNIVTNIWDLPQIQKFLK